MRGRGRGERMRGQVQGCCCLCCQFLDSVECADNDGMWSHGMCGLSLRNVDTRPISKFWQLGDKIFAMHYNAEQVRIANWYRAMLSSSESE